MQRTKVNVRISINLPVVHNISKGIQLAVIVYFIFLFFFEKNRGHQAFLWVIDISLSIPLFSLVIILSDIVLKFLPLACACVCLSIHRGHRDPVMAPLILQGPILGASPDTPFITHACSYLFKSQGWKEGAEIFQITLET